MYTFKICQIKSEKNDWILNEQMHSNINLFDLESVSLKVVFISLIGIHI